MDQDLVSRHGLLVVCTFQGKKVKGITLSLMNSKGVTICTGKTGPCGSAWFTVESAGEYLIKALCSYPDCVPRARWFRLWLDPCQTRKLSFLFRKAVHRGSGSITINLRDAFYHNLPLEGGTYQLWQVF